MTPPLPEEELRELHLYHRLKLKTTVLSCGHELQFRVAARDGTWIWCCRCARPAVVVRRSRAA